MRVHWIASHRREALEVVDRIASTLRERWDASWLHVHSSEEPPPIAELDCRRHADGWRVLDRSRGTVLGDIRVLDGRFSVVVEGAESEPFPMEGFDEAIDFFAYYLEARAA